MENIFSNPGTHRNLLSNVSVIRRPCELSFCSYANNVLQVRDSNHLLIIWYSSTSICSESLAIQLTHLNVVGLILLRRFHSRLVRLLFFLQVSESISDISTPLWQVRVFHLPQGTPYEINNSFNPISYISYDPSSCKLQVCKRDSPGLSIL